MEPDWVVPLTQDEMDLLLRIVPVDKNYDLWRKILHEKRMAIEKEVFHEDGQL